MPSSFGLRALLRTSAALVVMMAPASLAETSQKRIGARAEFGGLNAVGRLDLRGAGLCSGVLVAPDLVVTAAHCLYRGATRIDPNTLVFRGTGESVHGPVFEIAVARAVIHPDYRHAERDQLRQLLSDIALLQLHRPVPARLATPVVTASTVAGGTAVSVVTFEAGASPLLADQQACSILERAEGALALDCVLTRGSSGAPVFDQSGRTPRLVAIISRGTDDAQGAIVFGPKVEEPLHALILALRDGRAAFPKVQTRPPLIPGARKETGGRRVEP